MTTSTPAVRTSQPQPLQRSSHSYNTSHGGAPPMATTAKGDEALPLPSSNYLPGICVGHDPGWQWGNDPNGFDFGRSAQAKSASILMVNGCSGSSRDQDPVSRATYASADLRRGSSISTVTLGRERYSVDDDMSRNGEDLSSSRRTSSYRLDGEQQLQQRTLEASSQDYDKHLLSRIGGPNTPHRRQSSISSYAPNGIQDATQLLHAEPERRDSLPKLSLPDRPPSQVTSPTSARWSGAISPRFAGFWSERGPPDTFRAPATRHSSLTFDDSVSQRGSYDHSMFLNEELMEEGPMSNLNIHDRSPGALEDYQQGLRAGAKRRASSPPRDEGRDHLPSISSASGQSEPHPRRSTQQLTGRASPVSRFRPNHSSISSVSSFAPRHGSLGSSLGIASGPGSATSYGSGRVSPGALSPSVVDPELRTLTPYARPKLPVTHHQRALSESAQGGIKPSTDEASQIRHNSISHMQDLHICDCCPKKPRKFDSADELTLHQNEKSYSCAYCPNRFKNKNEAERHQNSLHLRRHSWSCAVLGGVEAAFHTTSSTNATDSCGYCGQEFASPPQWDVRAEHLNIAHKFGECNQTKKFFRADHFRQHLKHSHAGTSGKWTNMLETACMKDEPPPEKRVGVSGTGSPAAPALLVTTNGLVAPHPAYGVIAETPHDR